MILDLDCPVCGTDDHVSLVEVLPDSRRKLRCSPCGEEWTRGTAAFQAPAPPTLAAIKARFPKPGDVEPTCLARAQELKREFLIAVPVPEPAVAVYWDYYQRVFSGDGLPSAAPQDRKDFANSNIGANPGNMSVFNEAWNEMGLPNDAVLARPVERSARRRRPGDSGTVAGSGHLGTSTARRTSARSEASEAELLGARWAV